MNRINTLLLSFIGLLVFNESNAQNSVLNFDGNDDFVDMGIDVGNAIVSIELWFKPATTYEATTETAGALLFRNDDQIDEFGLYIGQADWLGLEGRLVFSRRVGGDAHIVVSDGNTWMSDVWYHVAAVIDSIDGMKLYIDGELQADLDISTNPTGIATDTLTIGRWGDAFVRHFDGAIDEVRLWNRGLNHSEVVNNMCTALEPSSSIGLVGYWKFDEAEGNVAIDLSGNEYHGVINGAAWAIDTLCFTSAISEIYNSKVTSVYPNPFTDRVYIEIDNLNNEKVSFVLYNLFGQVVGEANEIVDGRIFFERRRQTNGVYFYQILLNNEVLTRGKLIIK